MTKNILPQVSPGATVTAVLLSSHWTWNTPGSRTQTLRLKGQQEESSDLSDFHLHHQHSRGEGGETRRLLSGQLRTWVWSWNQKKTMSGWLIYFFYKHMKISSVSLVNSRSDITVSQQINDLGRDPPVIFNLLWILVCFTVSLHLDQCLVTWPISFLPPAAGHLRPGLDLF